MTYRHILLAGNLLCCLLGLLAGRRAFSNARAYVQSDQAIVIEAVHYDGYAYQDRDEAIALRNLSGATVEIGGWVLTDGSSARAPLPHGTSIPPRSLIWLAGDDAAFEQQFGFAPQVVLAAWPGFANSGDEVLLFDQQGRAVDALVYGEGDAAIAGWSGAAVQPYTVRGVFGQEGQILSRKLDQQTGLPLADSDRGQDWSQDRGDAENGRRVRYPGWDLESFFFPVRSERPASLTIAVAPDNGLEFLVAAIDQARASIQVTSLTIENMALGSALAAAAQRGVQVSLLLEGSPVGGVTNQEKAICQTLEIAGGQCWFMISAATEHIYDRYRFVHAKYVIIDGKLAIISSENLSPNSLPDDDKADGTWGRRGVLLMTDNADIVQGLERILASDLDPANHADVLRWQADDPDYGIPPPGFVPIQSSGGITYPVRYPQPVTFYDARAFELQQAPENLLRSADGLLGLVGQAAEGDTLLVQQLQERPYWGSSTSNPTDDPNVRLEAFVAAARRGATVRFLLDAYLDDASSPLSNAATCTMLNDLARHEQLRLQCARANPTGLGIHNKMVLARVGGRGYVHVGSWNGTELASKGNREVALLVQSDAAYRYLSDMFERDRPQSLYLPAIAGDFGGYVHHLLISEVVYDSSGADAAEFIELANPTLQPIDLGNFSLGDAVSRDDFEDVRRFPAGVTLESGDVLVVAISALDFFERYRLWPDYEILETSPAVPNLVDDPAWGDTAALLRLGNQGDEVILRDTTDTAVDVLTYGAGAYPDHEPCPLLTSSNHSLERYPYWNDTNSCPADFRDWPFPSPGKKP